MFIERTTQRIVWITLAAITVNTLHVPISLADNWFPARTTTVQRLASQIDKVQKQIDANGTIVAKDPDVWGESRLMSHRSDFENVVKNQLNNFDFGRLNAAESTRDAAFLSQALSLQQALNGQPVTPTTATPPPGTTTAANSSATTYQTNLFLDNDAPGPSRDQLYGTTSTIVPRTGFSGPGFKSKFEGTNPELTIGLEQTIELDQLKRYLDHLNEIRRLNQGDDTTDSPGYAIHLVRVPVSVLPGKSTHEGYGAEVTMTIRPQLGDELLPNAFRDFVINGIRDRITPLVMYHADQGNIVEMKRAMFGYYFPEIYRQEEKAKLEKAKLEKADSAEHKETADADTTDTKISPLNYLDSARTYQEFQTYERAKWMALESIPANVLSSADIALHLDTARDEVEAATGVEQFAAQPGQRNGGLSIPWTHNDAVNGHTLVRVALDVFDLMARADSESVLKDKDKMEPGRRNLFYPDVANFIQDELEASYKLLSTEAAESLWQAHCGRDLALAILEFRRSITSEVVEYSGDGKPNWKEMKLESEIAIRRAAFFRDIKSMFPEGKDSTTATLAWHIIVESALLNEQLVTDMKDLASNKNAWAVNVGWMPFYGPNPPAEARAAFSQYVQCRWPIHVFALDPVTQDQNVASSFSRRREMQLILALAASNRALTLQSLTQFVRRLEYDLETIDLNRTSVGFTHGSDTFGWRFYPRVQVPKVKGNLGTAVHDLIGGGPNRDDDLNDRRLEPGIRECTALVVMPSFVPYAVLDSRSSWFKLADHHSILPPRFMSRKGDLRDAVDLSADVVELRNLANSCFQDAHLYRDGDIYRLKRAIETLDRSLPLQTAYVEVPYENLLGGFDLFRSDVQGLKPTLRGWYGAPGIMIADHGELTGTLGRRVVAARIKLAELKTKQHELTLTKPDDGELKTVSDLIPKVKGVLDAAVEDFNAARSIPGPDTTLFLVGKNFSVLDTRVIAGGVEIPGDKVKLISRDVIQITVSSSVATVSESGRRYVDVHLATPYGPTPRLRIPVANDEGVSVSAAVSSAAAAKKDAAAAKASADEARKAAPGFDWQKKEVSMTYQRSFSINGLTWNGTDRPTIVYENATPFSVTPTGPEIEFAFYLNVKNSGQSKAEAIRDAQGRKLGTPLLARFAGTSRGEDVFAYNFNDARMPPQDLLLNAIQSVLINHLGEIEELSVDAFIHVIEQTPAAPATMVTPHVDELPVIHLPELKIKIVKPTVSP